MKIDWQFLTTTQDIDALAERSKQQPCLLFKHSTRCPISSLAKQRLEGNWDFSADQLEPYFLDLIAHRDVSHYIADTFDVPHESPQVLLIYQGACYYDVSHLDISVPDLHTVELPQTI